ncbi:MAG: TIGR04086 family membrane protein [Lachnospiraceae bacterium]|nr:TIGR04086 family membrane protein [Lachnospiraceae bacterium]
MKTGAIVQVIKGVVLAYGISAVLLVILAFLMFQWDISEGVVRGGIIFAYVFSCFISGMVVSSHHTGRKYLWGLLMGAIYYIILLITSMICNRALFMNIPGILPALFLCLFGGMLGGMLQAGRK